MTGRLPKALILLVLAALAGGLAGCGGDGSSPAPSAAGAPSSSGTATTSASGDCPDAIADDTYVRATSAQVEGDVVEVTATPARRVCGGANNSHYELEDTTEQLTVAASAPVVLLTTTPSGIGHETVAATELPQRLVDDRFDQIFLVHGPSSAVTGLEEQYQP